MAVPLWDSLKGQLVPLVIAMLGSPIFMKFWPKPRAKLTYGIAHNFVYVITNLQAGQPGQSATLAVTTTRHRIANVGKVPATNVTALLNWEPRGVNLAPIRPYKAKTQQDLRYLIELGTLQPGEEVNLEVFSDGTNAPSMVHVRAAECAANDIQIWIQPVPNSKVIGLNAGLRVLGWAWLLMMAWQLGSYIWAHINH
jgi:hypothetical protein